MKIIKLTADNFKILKAVEISPEGNIITIGGKNGQGKSSVLDAIWVALAGRSAAPPKPVREGEDACTIKLDLGELKITRTFKLKDGDKYTDTVKVENSEGLRFGSPQKVLDALMGEIGFDPFEFMRMKPDDQADMLLKLVPLPIDIEEMAEADDYDYQSRRYINREIKRLGIELDSVPAGKIPDGIRDRSTIADELASSVDFNGEIIRKKEGREKAVNQVAGAKARAGELRKEAAELLSEADTLEKQAADLQGKINAAKPLPAMRDVAALRAELEESEKIQGIRERLELRATIKKNLDHQRSQSEKLTAAMADREKEREAALAKAKMPVEGLGFSVSNGKPVVTYQGLPFTPDQISTAAQLRVSTAIAMAANPQLRVLRISDGSLLDDDAMKMLAEMADTEDFQLFIERVGDGGVGIILEAGEIKD